MAHVLRYLLVIAVTVSLLGAGGVAGSDVSSSAQPSSEIEQTNTGELLFEVDRADVSGESVHFTLTVGESELQNRTLTNPLNRSSGTRLAFPIPAKNLPDSVSLESAQVTYKTEPGADGDLLARDTLDLRFVGLTDNASFIENTGNLSIETTTQVGLGDDIHEAATALNSGVRTFPFRASDEEIVILRRSQFDEILYSSTTITIQEAPGGPTISIPDGTQFDLQTIAEDRSTATLTADGLVYESPLIVTDRQYTVTVTTQAPNGTFGRALNAGQQRLQITQSQLKVAEQLSLEISVDGTVIATETLSRQSIGGTVGTIGRDGATVKVDRGLSGEIQNGLVRAANGVYEIEAASINQNSSFTVHTISGDRMLSKNGTYNMVLELDDGSAVVVTTQSVPSPDRLSQLVDDPASSSGSESGVVKQTINWLTAEQLGPVPNGMLLLGLLVIVGSIGGYTFFRGSSFRGGSAPATRDITVSITDSSGNTINSGVTAKIVDPSADAHGTGAAVSQASDISGGSVKFGDVSGEHELVVEYNGQRKRNKLQMTGGSVSVSFDPISYSATVTDQNGSAIADATVTVSFDDGERTDTTDASGSVRMELPATAENPVVSVDHDRFEASDTEADTPSDLPATLTLTPKMGTLVINRQIGDTSIETLSQARQEVLSEQIQLEWMGESPDAVTQTGPGTVEATVGEYTVAMSLPGENFADAQQRIRIEKDSETRAQINIPFTYGLSTEQDRQLAELRTELDDLTQTRNLDTAFHGYYASVGGTLADVIEAIPAAGVSFAGRDVTPDSAVNGLLEAGTQAVQAVNQGLGTKSCVDLFTTCTRLPEADVQWERDPSIEEFLVLCEGGRTEFRRTINTEIDDIESKISSQQGTVRTVAPAQAVVEQLRDWAIGDYSGIDVHVAAVAFTTRAYADAIGAIFDQPELVERLNESMF